MRTWRPRCCDGVAATLGEVIESLRRAGVGVRELRLTSGGAASPRLRELVAAAARAPVRRVGEDEGPARGVALMARCLGASDAALAEAAATWVRPGPQEVPEEADVLRLGRVRERLDALRRLRL